MSTFNELFDSSNYTADKDGFTVKVVYRVYEKDPFSITGFTALGTPHPVISSAYLSSISVKPDEGMYNGDTTCIVTYTYEPQERSGGTPNSNGEVWVWDMSARTAHIDSVPETTDQYTFDKDNPAGENISTVLGKDGDNIKGADVYRPSGSLKVTKYMPKATANQAFRQTLYAMQNTLNNASWQDWTKYEVLFLGSRIRYDETNSLAQVDYAFLFGESTANVTYDIFKTDAISGTPFTTVTLKSAMDGTSTIYPFDLIETAMAEKDLPVSSGDPSQGTEKVRGIESVSVSKVYQTSDFSALGLVGP